LSCRFPGAGGGSSGGGGGGGGGGARTVDASLDAGAGANYAEEDDDLYG